MVIADYPDDQIISCGVVIYKHIDEYDIIIRITLTDGISSRSSMNLEDGKLRNKVAMNNL